MTGEVLLGGELVWLGAVGAGAGDDAAVGVAHGLPLVVSKLPARLQSYCPHLIAPRSRRSRGLGSRDRPTGHGELVGGKRRLLLVVRSVLAGAGGEVASAGRVSSRKSVFGGESPHGLGLVGAGTRTGVGAVQLATLLLADAIRGGNGEVPPLRDHSPGSCRGPVRSWTRSVHRGGINSP